VSPFAADARRRIQARQAAAPTSKARQKAGHQTGTPEFPKASPRSASKTAWPASAATTIHPLDLNPATAAIAKTAIATDSGSTA
jgi:hypothetical protein